MDADKAAFIFGGVPTDTDADTDADADDEETRRHLVKRRVVTEFPELDDGSAESTLIVFVHQLVAHQSAEVAS